MINAINIRVYGICIKDNRLMVLKEGYAGEKLIKLPGGGLEFGEGILDCLHREFLEELNLKIKVVEHFYTQEVFLASRFRENEQLLTIYYKVEISNIEELKILDSGIESVEWLPINAENTLPLPIDQLVFEKLQKLMIL